MLPAGVLSLAIRARVW